MLVHALIKVLFIFFSSSVEAERHPLLRRNSILARSLRPLTKPLAHQLTKRGLVKRSQCVLGGFGSEGSRDTEKQYTTVTTIITTVQGNSTQTLSSAIAKPTGTGIPSSFTLATDSNGDKFFDDFDFFTDADPTNGFVTYVSEDVARTDKLIGTQSDKVVVKADNTTTLASAGMRKSVRIISKAEFKEGDLLILDAEHLPYGCAQWPAFWLLGVGAEWPNAGEIDIFEGVNNNEANSMAMHTKKGCKVAEPMQASGDIQGTDCDALANENSGCAIHEKASTKSFGKPLNDNGGGVWATLWYSDAISIWFFERQNIPDDIDSKAPEPSKWGKPTASWATSSCDLSTYIKPQNWM